MTGSHPMWSDSALQRDSVVRGRRGQAHRHSTAIAQTAIVRRGIVVSLPVCAGVERAHVHVRMHMRVRVRVHVFASRRASGE